MSDRRQPPPPAMLRWSAVFAGAAISVALWVLLQLVGMGVGLAAIDLDDSGSLRSVGIGTTVWSMLAPLIALFIGGFFAAKMAATYDQKVGASHGFVTWAIASLLGIVAMACLAAMLARGAAGLTNMFPPENPENVALDPSLHQKEIQDATDHTGKVLLGVGLSMLLGLGAALLGGFVGGRHVMRPRRRTAEVPVVPPPDEPPVDAPHVTA